MLAIFRDCAILFPVSERNNNEINKMNNENANFSETEYNGHTAKKNNTF